MHIADSIQASPIHMVGYRSCQLGRVPLSVLRKKLDSANTLFCFLVCPLQASWRVVNYPISADEAGHRGRNK